AIVVSNALHAYDVRLFADGWFDVFFTTTSGSPSYKQVATREQFLALASGAHPVYLLDVRYAYRPGKDVELAHPSVTAPAPPLPRGALGQLPATRACYPSLDPLRTAFPRPFVSFLGAPDLVNAFYHGPRQDGAAFSSEVSAEYWLYRVTAPPRG